MIQRVQFSINPEDVHNDDILRSKIKPLISKNLESFNYKFIKRSLDARSKKIKIQCVIDVYIDENIPNNKPYYSAKNVAKEKSVTIIGAGPAGLFAALHAISKGIKPIIFERGKNVRDRRRDLADLNKRGVVNPESNYCFGEGGAGTYSDGKLYTRSKKRGDVKT